MTSPSSPITVPADSNSTLDTSGDRSSPEDYAITAITSAVSLFVLIGAIFVIIARNYEPVKIKQIHIVIPSAFSGIIFMMSQLIVNNHYQLDPAKFFNLCVLWAFWLNLVLGLAIWMCCLILRPFRLVYTFKYQKAITPQRAYIMLIIGVSPWIIYAVFAQAFNGWAFRTDKDICGSSTIGWTIGIFAYIAAYVILYLIVVGILEKIKKDSRFKEYLENYYFEFPIIRLGIIMVIILAVLNVIIWAIKEAFPVSPDVKVWGRFIQTLTGDFAVTFFFCVPMLKPLIKFFFDRDRYLERYRDSITKMRRSHATHGTEAESEDEEKKEKSHEEETTVNGNSSTPQPNGDNSVEKKEETVENNV